jgi:type I restriction enzyme M protein
MSSQASSAGHAEKDVRRKIAETGDVDVMISIRSNFFYTRSVPCELWFFDRAKPPERQDKVLMLDARNIFRKVSRKINDFSPEQTQNLAAIIWLYRGQRSRFLALVSSYLRRLCVESAAVSATIEVFNETLTDLRQWLSSSAEAAKTDGAFNDDGGTASPDAVTELEEAVSLYEIDAATLIASLYSYCEQYGEAIPDTNMLQQTACAAYNPHAEAIRGLIKQVDLLYRLASQAAALSRAALATTPAGLPGRRTVTRLSKKLEWNRRTAVEQLKRAVYFYRQVVWPQERFPNAELQAVPGLVKLVSRSEIAAADWSLSPSRHTGVPLADEDQDFDFEQVLSDIHTELTDLNLEAVELSARIQKNFEELGV